MDRPERGSTTLADRLNHLFATVHPPDRKEYTVDEVANALRDRVSATYIWQLRKGARDNPTKKHLEALAEFFHVPVAYFFDTEAAERIDTELAFLVAMRDAGVRKISLRAVGFDPSSLETVQAVMDQLRLLKQLPPVTDDDLDHQTPE